MRPTLVGRQRLLAEVQACLAAGRSVLLAGPAGSGKSAIIDALCRPGLLVVDPFRDITTPHACAIRRALNRGVLALAATRSLEPRDMGHVGRIFWRFQVVRVRPLSSRDIARIIAGALGTGTDTAVPVDVEWIAQATDVACGLPGRAVALASVAVARWRERRVVVPPELALIVAQQDVLVHTLETSTRGRSPRESSS